MPHKILNAIAALVLALSPSFALAQNTADEIGDDLFLAQPSSAVEAGKDAFAVGFSTLLSGTVGEDAHAVGLSVEVDADTEGDLYAVGGSVAVRGDVGSDLTIVGGTIRTHASSSTSENARITGGSVTIDGAVEGALILSGGDVTLNAPIGGDAFVSAGRIRFGKNARIDGRLTYSTGSPIDVPESVADPTRVTFQKSEGRGLERAKDWNWPQNPSWDVGPGTILGALAATIGSFLLVGGVFLTFAPGLVAKLRKSVVQRPGRTALTGLIIMSTLFGSVPIFAMTIIGIPLVPLAILAVLIVWFLGYILGAYSLGMGIARSVGMQEDPSIAVRLLVLAATAFVAALLNYIPFVGWLANLLLVFIGVGAITFALLERWLPNMKPSLEAP